MAEGVADGPGAQLSAEYLEFNSVVPIGISESVLTVGTWQSPVDTAVLDDLSVLYGTCVSTTTISREEGHALIRRGWGASVSRANAMLAAAPEADSDLGSESISDLRSLANEAPVIQLVNLFLLEALGHRASDIHLESAPGHLAVRYRVDGILRDASTPPVHMAPALLSRLKIMASLDIAERRIPQDGRIRLRLADRDVDVRVSSIPTLHGESVALRLLDGRGNRIALNEIGMPAEMLGDFRRVIAKPQGMILVTGPTGSGKTTTLYAAIEEIRSGRDKILTIEDPVEYQLDGVSQMPINRKQGVTFASALRAVLRHDPDVLMVGEIRDPETADVATQASLTGHLVFSTLHTNDAVGAIARMLDLGVDRYLIAATLNAVVAQRLVRRICDCLGPARSSRGVEAVGASIDCPSCRGSGYFGRTGAYELLLITPQLRTAIQNGLAPEECHRIAMSAGFRPLGVHGAALVAEGLTTEAEVRRAIGTLDDLPCT